MTIFVTVFSINKNMTNALTKAVNQQQTTAIRTLFSVTTCLYLNPNKRARSLSTLRAVDMSIETPQKIMERIALLTIITSTVLKPFSSMLAKSGWEVRATPRSVIARHWNNSLVGGWREVTLRRATKIRVLPRDAVMEKRIFTAAIMSIDNSTGTVKFKVMFSTSAGVTFAIPRPTVQIHWEVL